MFAKLAVVILTIGMCGCTLLSLRHARLQAAHELTRAQMRVRECDDHLWALRADIGRRVMPDRVRQMANALGSFRPMLPLPGDVQHRTDYAQALDGLEPLVPEAIPPSVQAPTPAQVRQVSHAASPAKPATKPVPSKPVAGPSKHASNIRPEPQR